MTRLAFAVLLSACATSATPDSMSSGGGKADGTADEACTRDYITWALETWKPAVAAGDPSALAAVAQTAPCRDELLDPSAYDTWSDITFGAVFAPYLQQYTAAMTALISAGNPAFGDVAAFTAAATPSPAAAALVKATLAARPAAAFERVDETGWMGQYHTVAEQLLLQLSYADLQYFEGPWTLNSGEAAALDLLEQTRPTTFRDGAYAAWMDEYSDFLQHGASTTDSADDYVSSDPRLGCFQDETAPCGRTFVLDRIAALAPPAKGDGDSTRFIIELSLWAPLAASSTPESTANDHAQLARITKVRPAHVTGLDAYKRWLDVVSDVAGTPELTSDVLPAHPCVAASDASAAETAHAALASAHPELADATAPATCP
jgi:hypothetical protein